MIKIILILLTLSCIIYASYVAIKQFKPYKAILTGLAFVGIAALILTTITLLF
jgi:formate-dependent nitrite reductase membrane component NrfD